MSDSAADVHELVAAAHALNSRITKAVGDFAMLLPNSWEEVNRFRAALAAFEEDEDEYGDE